ncbi:MAG: OmpA family protein [Pseudomonadota bacterium]
MIRFISKATLAISLVAGALAMTHSAHAQQTPSAATIYKKLNRAVPAGQAAAPRQRVSVDELKRNRRLRSQLPSINIQSINFEFGSAAISPRERWKVGNIADALLRFRRNRNERFLLEGHTDAVGSYEKNQFLSEDRAQSLKRALVNWFGVPPRMLITVGYGEEQLLINTQRPDWRNRRVTLRRATRYLR